MIQTNNVKNIDRYLQLITNFEFLHYYYFTSPFSPIIIHSLLSFHSFHFLNIKYLFIQMRISNVNFFSNITCDRKEVLQ